MTLRVCLNQLPIVYQYIMCTKFYTGKDPSISGDKMSLASVLQHVIVTAWVEGWQAETMDEDLNAKECLMKKINKKNKTLRTWEHKTSIMLHAQIMTDKEQEKNKGCIHNG